VDENAAGAESGDDLIFASFESGIYVEVHSEGDSGTDSFILTVAWVRREDFTPAFDDPQCFIRQKWEAAACRGPDMPLYANYDLGTTQEEVVAADGGTWLGDGAEYDIDAGGSP